MDNPKEIAVYDAAARTDDVTISSSSDIDNSGHGKVAHLESIEQVRTIERVGTNAQYYEKDGLRTEGDGLDHDGSHHKVRVTAKYTFLFSG